MWHLTHISHTQHLFLFANLFPWHIPPFTRLLAPAKSNAVVVHVLLRWPVTRGHNQTLVCCLPVNLLHHSHIYVATYISYILLLYILPVTLALTLVVMCGLLLIRLCLQPPTTFIVNCIKAYLPDLIDQKLFYGQKTNLIQLLVGIAGGKRWPDQARKAGVEERRRRFSRNRTTRL